MAWTTFTSLHKNQSMAFSCTRFKNTYRMGRASDHPYRHPSSPFLDGIQVVIPSEREPTRNLWRPSFGCSPPPAIEDDDVQLTELEKHTQECVYGRAFYRTWRSWKFPASPNTSNAMNRKKCLMDACDDQFHDLDSAFRHMNECKVLKSHAERVSSPAQSSLPPAPAPLAVAHPDPSHSKCSRCHSTRCRAKSFCLRRIKSFQDGLMRLRGGPPLTNVTMDGATELPSDSWSANCPPPPYCLESQSLADIRGTHHALDLKKAKTVQEASELDVASYRFEMGTTTDRFELASDPIHNNSNSVTTCDPRDGVSKSLASKISEPRSFCCGQHSPDSMYSRSSVSPPSTTPSLPPIHATTIQGPGTGLDRAQTYGSTETQDVEYPTLLLTDGSPPTRSTSRFACDSRPQHPLSHLGVPIPFQNCPKIRHPQPTLLEERVLTTTTRPGFDWLSSPSLAFLPRETPVYLNQLFIETLESLKITLSNLRKSDEIYGTDPICATSLSQLSDEVVLHGGLSTLEALLQGNDEDLDVSKLCFAHLALAMAIEIKAIIMPDTYEALHGDFRQMVESEGGAGFTGRFLDIAIFFLKVLNPDNSTRDGLQDQAGEENIPRAVYLNFKAMRGYLMGSVLSPTQELSSSTTDSVLDPGTNHSRIRGEAHMLLPFRQQSCQPAGSISAGLDTTSHFGSQVPQDLETLAHRPPTHYGPPLRAGPMAPIPPPVTTVDPGGRRRVRKSAETVHEKSENRTPLNTCCSQCGFYPSAGPGQQKKLARHWNTHKHRCITSRIKAHHEVKAESATQSQPQEEMLSQIRAADATPSADITTGHGGERVFHCPLLSMDGSPCPKTFTRRDNMKTHTIKRKHRDVSN